MLAHYQTKNATLAAAKKAETSVHQLEKQKEKLTAEVYFFAQQQKRLTQNLSKIQHRYPLCPACRALSRKNPYRSLRVEMQKKLALYQEEKKRLEAQRQLFVQESQAYRQKIQKLETKYPSKYARRGRISTAFLAGASKRYQGVRVWRTFFMLRRISFLLLALLLAHYPNALEVDSPATWEKVYAQLQTQGKG